MLGTNVKRLTIEEVRHLAGDVAAATAELPRLLATLQAEDEELRAWTSDVLQTLERVPASWAPDLGQVCMHANPAVASWACKLLPRVGDIASEHQVPLGQALSAHPNLGVRQQAALALGKVPNLNPHTRELLEAAASSDDPRLSRLASSALENNHAA